MSSSPHSGPSGTSAGRKYRDEAARDSDDNGAAESSGRDAAGATSRFEDPNDKLKQQLSDWGDATAHTSEPYEEGEEYEMLLDPNLPGDDEGPSRGATSQDSIDLDDDEAHLKGGAEQEDSPYPEVRAAVHNYDEDLPCNTVRAWTIGMTLVTLGASMNTLFSLRRPTIGLGSLIAQIIAWPMGKAWEKVMPERHYHTFGIRWSLNPGPFNVKEHSVIVVMANVSFSVAYATDIILAQKVFYKQDFGMVFQLLLAITTQSLGYGIAGTMRKFLVYPASMIWPGNLVAVALLNAMHEKPAPPDPTIIGGTMPRYRWFGVITLGSFLYYFIPGFFAQFLSVFAFATWMAPNNAVVNQLFGGNTGLSILPITFDWTQIAGFVGSPLIPPWHAIANTLVGVVVFFIGMSSFLHYTGVWYSLYLPMSDASTYDNTGAPYNTTRILTKDFVLDEEAYKAYSPLFISTTFAIAYGLSFAAITSLIVYTFLHHRKTIWRQYQNSTTEKPDIHMKLMRKYVEAPTWWYTGLFVIVLLFGFYTVLAYPTNLTWWAFLLAVGISFAFSLPIGIIQAVTNTQIGLNVLTEFVYGYIQPGRPLALMIFKTFGYITMSQALGFMADLKFGHYMKIPPRTMFMSQVVATTFSCFIQIVVLNLALANIDGVCEPTQPEHFSCPGGRVFFSASVIWGLIGPARIFSIGQIYSGLFWFFLLGAITPIVIYYYTKKHPKSFTSASHIRWCRLNSSSLSAQLFIVGVVGFVFQFWIKRRHFRWWSRLNFLTSSGLDLGLALATLFIFFAFTLHDIKPPSWWGNNVVENTMDSQGTAIQVKLPPGETFGPQVW
ncbi:Sexual differentiation process protein isp4 [Apiospora hydei]|uniref:Sexual differentiation process protein isp4 n=1 Tax=Apiospora hydei TaxID=1337664 RepID=A0ABR1X3N3_9PEZI